MLNETERGFSRLINKIAVTMLVFFGMFQILCTVWIQIDLILYRLLPPIAAEVTSQLIYAVIYLASFMTPAFVLRGLMGKDYAPMPLKKTLPRDSFAYIIAGIGGILAIAYLNAMLLEVFNYSEFQSGLMGESESMANYQIVLSFITTAIVPGICEEFLFRGAIMTNLKPYGKAPAIIISAVLFGLMHQNAGQLLYATAAGLVLGWVAYETGSIWCGILMHFLNNFISVGESAVASRIPIGLANIVLPIFECLLFAAAVVCGIYIILKHEKKKRERIGLTDGIFGRTLSEARDDETVEIVMARGRVTRLFFSPVMIVFIVLAAVEMALLLLMSLFGDILTI